LLQPEAIFGIQKGKKAFASPLGGAYTTPPTSAGFKGANCNGGEGMEGTNWG